MRRHRERQSSREPFLGFRFDRDRTREANGNKSFLFLNRVSCTVRSGSTHFDALKSIAESAERSIPLKFINEQLKGTVLVRGRAAFDDAWKAIDLIVTNYPGLRWWMTADGLVVDQVLPDLESLSEFERIVGSMLSGQPRISKEILQAVAQKLDSEGVLFKLQPKEQGTITTENRKRRKKVIHNFSTAVANPITVRAIRRAIYRARAKYEQAIAMSRQSDWTDI